MKRIRNAALLAAAMAVTSFTQAQEPQTARQRSLADETLVTRTPHAPRLADPTEQATLKQLDHVHEGRLNERSRGEHRHKSREEKQRLREAN